MNDKNKYPKGAVIDYQLKSFLRKTLPKIKRDLVNCDFELRSLSNCGAYPKSDLGVSIIANDKESRIIGAQFCDNAWGCPECTPIKLQRYANRISAAIDALSNQNLVPIMITFTTFHTKNIRVEDMLNIIAHAYTNISKKANWSRKKTHETIKIQKNHIKGNTYQKNGTWQQFIQHFNIRHFVKGLEITYGEHGWHPHYHCLFFIEKSRLKEIDADNWEEKLQKYWNKTLFRSQQKFINPQTYPKSHQVFFSLQEKYFADPQNTHKGLTISRNPDNSVRVMSSGNYISGWGGDNELSSGLKIANPGHFTPLQLLNKAFCEDNEEALNLYVDVMLAIHRLHKHRIDFSRTGLNTIIRNWMNSHEYLEQAKKKKMQTVQARGILPYRNVAWWSSRQWSEIYTSDKYSSYPIILLIRIFATYENGHELICELCQTFDLPIPLKSYPIPTINPAEIFNQKLFAA